MSPRYALLTDGQIAVVSDGNRTYRGKFPADILDAGGLKPKSTFMWRQDPEPELLHIILYLPLPLECINAKSLGAIGAGEQ